MFGGLFGKKKKTEDEAPNRLASSVTSTILGVVGQRGIPPMPGSAQKAFKLAVDPNAEARDFIEVIESDEGLSARILKIANSVFFDRGKQSKTIEEAVVIIGMNELRCLLNATSLSELFPTSNPARTQAWSNDIATALTARTLALRFAPQKAEILFLGGLMHDIGKLVLIQRASGDYSTVMKKVEETGCSFAEAEGEIFPFDHTEVGQLIGERWNFTPELIDMIRNHHRPLSELGNPGSPTLPGIVSAADALSHAFGLGHPRGFTKFRARYEQKLEEIFDFLGIPQNERKDLTANVQKTFEVEYELYSGKQIR